MYAHAVISTYVYSVKDNNAILKICNFYARSQNCEERLLARSCLSVRLSAWNISAVTEKDFDEIWCLSDFFEKYVVKIKIS